MIDLTDIPASWAGRDIRVYRPGMSIEGRVSRIDSEGVTRTLGSMQSRGSSLVTIHTEITVSLDTPEGPLEFSNVRPGSYNIDLIEEG